MKQTRDVCVLDASTVIRAFIDMEHSDAARNLLQNLVESDARIIVPELLYTECANVLWKYVRFGRLAKSTAEQYMQEILDLRLRSISSHDVASQALDLAITTGASVYDAYYGVVAERFGASFITADKRLVPKLTATSIDIVYLPECH